MRDICIAISSIRNSTTATKSVACTCIRFRVTSNLASFRHRISFELITKPLYAPFIFIEI